MSFQKKHEFSGHDAAIYALTEGRKSTTLFSAGADRVVAEWDAENFEPVSFSVRVEHAVFSMHHDTHRALLFCGNIRGGIQVIDFKEGKEVRHFQTHKKGVFCFTHTDSHLFSAGGDGSICRWSLDDLYLEKQEKLSQSKIRSIQLTTTGVLIAADISGNVFYLDPVSLKEISRLRLEGGAVSAMVWLEKKDLLVTGGKDAHIRAYKIDDSGKAEHVLSIPAHNYPIYNLATNPSQTLISSVSRDKTVKLWDADSIEFTQRLDVKMGGHTHSVNDQHWINNELLASAGDDKKIKLWQEASTK